MLTSLSITKWHRTHHDNLVLTCLDVGHGQAILAQLPPNTNYLFDAGSLNITSIGRRIVNPFLNYTAINKIDSLIISHSDIDHINAIPEITEYCKTAGIYANNAFFPKANRWSAAKFLKVSLKENDLVIQPLDKNSNIPSNLKILWPDEQIEKLSQLTDNDKSLVCLLEFAGKKILLCSDIEQFAQKKLLQLYPDLKANVVIAPHHGSTNTLDPHFIEKLQPDILIHSCGRRLYEKLQPTNNSNKTKSFYTARDGAVTIQIQKNGKIKIDTFH